MTVPTDPTAKLRREILSEVVQHPFTLLPLATGILGGAWAVFMQPSVASVGAAIGGTCLSVIGAAWTLLFRGERIKTRVVERWRREENEAVERKRQQFVDRLSRTRATEAAYESLLAVRNHAMTMLESENLLPSQRAHFTDLVEKNFESCLPILATAAEQVHSADRHQRDSAQEAIRHAAEVEATITRMIEELPTDLDALAQAREQLDHLERTLEAVKRVDDELRRPPAEIREIG